MKRLVQVLLGLAISAGALWLTFRGKDLGAIWRAMQDGDYRYLPPYLLIMACIHLLRTVRWGLLLEPVATISFARLNAVSAVGFAALVALPFRLGEFARPALIAERGKLRASAALSSVVVERVADGIFSGLLLLLTLFAVPEGTPHLPEIRKAGWLVSGLFGGLLAFLVLAYLNRSLAVRLTSRLLDPVSARLSARVSGMLDAFIHGLRMVPSRGKLALFFLLTAAYWAINGWGMQLLARGFGLQLGLIDAFTVMGVLVAGVMIPAGPGMVGTFQLAIGFGLSLFVTSEVAATRGAAYANVLWAAQVAFQLALGAVFLFSRHVDTSYLFQSGSRTGDALEAEEAEYKAEGDGAP